MNKLEGVVDKYLQANIVFSKFSRDYMGLKKDYPIRPSELAVLNIITRREGKFTPLMIKELLEVSKPMITAYINILEKKGYVYKDFALSDKRSFYVMPTEKARSLVEETERKTTDTLKEIENELGEEGFSTLVTLLKKTQMTLKTKGE